MSASRACETFVTAVATLREMIKTDRGIAAHPNLARRFESWSKVTMLSTDTPEFGQYCELIYQTTCFAPPSVMPGKNGLYIPTDARFANGKHDIVFLAMNADNLIFLKTRPEQPAKHVGINYEMVCVVFVASAGAASIDKLDQAEKKMVLSADELAKVGFAVSGIRIVKVVAGLTGAVVPVTKVAPVRQSKRYDMVTIETWDIRELQFNPLLHKFTPLHEPVDALPANAFDKLPKASRRALAIAKKETDKIPILYATDPIARRLGFVRGQIIHVLRRSLNEGGLASTFRRVE